VTICISVHPTPNSGGDLSPASPRDLCPCNFHICLVVVPLMWCSLMCTCTCTLDNPALLVIYQTITCIEFHNPNTSLNQQLILSTATVTFTSCTHSSFTEMSSQQCRRNRVLLLLITTLVNNSVSLAPYMTAVLRSCCAEWLLINCHAV